MWSSNLQPCSPKGASQMPQFVLVFVFKILLSRIFILKFEQKATDYWPFEDTQQQSTVRKTKVILINK